MDERPHSKSETRAEGAGHDRSLYAFFACWARACGHCASGGPRTRPDEHTRAKWLVTHGDLPDGLPHEMRLAGSCLERDLIRRETRQTTGGPAPRRILDQEPIIEVDPKRKVLEEAGLNTDHIPRARNGCAIFGAR